KGGVVLGKKKIVFLILVFGIILSSILFYDEYISSAPNQYMGSSKRVIVWLITIGIGIHYLSLDAKPQLVPIAFTSEKDNNKNNNKPKVSFKDVAGLEEIKEEL